MSKIDENTPGYIAPGSSSATIAQLSRPVSRRRYVTSDTNRMGVNGNHVPVAYGFRVKKAKKGAR